MRTIRADCVHAAPYGGEGLENRVLPPEAAWPQGSTPFQPYSNPTSGLAVGCSKQTNADPFSGTKIQGYEQLSKLGVGFYPVCSDKSPAVRKLIREITTEPIKIRHWIEHRHHKQFAIRILKKSRLFVIDTEGSFKNGKRGPDGELVFHELLEEHGINLSLCPTTRTPSMGRHRYFRAPKGFPIRSSIGLWPGVDILAAGSNVILPGTRSDQGEYEAWVGFDECPIPEVPRELLKLIREKQKTHKASIPKPQRPFTEMPTGDASAPSKQQWWRLRRNKVFGKFWNKMRKRGDESDSAYQYHLAKACFCCGLTFFQVEFVILQWRSKHGLPLECPKLRRSSIPAAWQEVAGWVEQWQSERLANAERRKVAKTKARILAHIEASGTPQMPASLSRSLSISRECAKKALQRLETSGKLRRTEEGYVLAAPVGTFSCITTSPIATTQPALPSLLEIDSSRIRSKIAAASSRKPRILKPCALKPTPTWHASKVEKQKLSRGELRKRGWPPTLIDVKFPNEEDFELKTFRIEHWRGLKIVTTQLYPVGRIKAYENELGFEEERAFHIHGATHEQFAS